MRRLIRIVRNILLLLITAILILAGVLAFNVFSHGSRQLQVAAVPRAAVDAQAAAGRLSEEIRFRTISSFEKPDQHADALRGMQAHIETMLSGVSRCGQTRDRRQIQPALYVGRLGPEGCADRAAGASGRRAGRTRHRKGLAAAAL